MSKLQEDMAELSKKELSRKQFLGAVGGSFLGMIGVFRVLQALNTPEPDLATSHQEVFGEREYGYSDKPSTPAASPQQFDQDVFG